MGISSGTGAVGFMPVGVVVPFAGSTSPAGWELCYGQAISRTTYAGLFATVGTTYGSGDGSTTFNVPDLRGRVVAGEDDMGGTAANRITNAVSGIVGTTLGAVGGNQIMPLHSHPNTATFSGTAGTTGSKNIDHTHSFTPVATSLSFGWSISGGGAGYMTSGTTTTGGMNSNATHDHSFTPAGTVTMTNANAGTGSSANVQPTIILNYIIKAA